MYDLGKFTLQDMTHCGEAIQQLELQAKDMDEMANLLVHYFYDHLIDKQTGEKTCALVRFFMTYPYIELDKESRKSVDTMPGVRSASHDMNCLTLLSTVGIKPEWNSTRLSSKHRVIPLVNKQEVEQIPMISQLFYQLGLDINNVLHPDPNLVAKLESKIFNVFLVPDALGNPHIPDQEGFVVPFGIKSVLGFGSMLPTGNLFVVIIFSKVRIPRNTADMFKNLALSARMAVLPLVTKKIFKKEKTEITESERLTSLLATKRNLLEVYKKTAIEQANHLESISLNRTDNLSPTLLNSISNEEKDSLKKEGEGYSISLDFNKIPESEKVSLLAWLRSAIEKIE